jgi:hypothetical protein
MTYPPVTLITLAPNVRKIRFNCCKPTLILKFRDSRDLPHSRCRSEKVLTGLVCWGMSQSIDIVRNSLPSPNELALESVEETGDGIVFRALAKRLPSCPTCLQSQVSYHSLYVRRVRDLPWQGRRVEIHFQTRRFRCRNKECLRKVFAEQLPAVVAPNARETTRLREILGIVGYALGCRANGF